MPGKLVHQALALVSAYRLTKLPGTLYEGGVFSIQMIIPSDHPFKPPLCKSLTPVYHPNISPEGSIGADIPGDNWVMYMSLESGKAI